MHEKLNKLLSMGRIKIVEGQAWPIYEHYLSPSDGTPCGDIWAYQPYTEGTVFGTENGIDDDVRWLSPHDQERLGYPTQKPLALLERIIQASSNEGDVVLDPFCGCGTTIDAAQKLNRNWIGIDITNLAISLIKHRLHNTYGDEIKYDVIGEPVSDADAAQLAHDDPYQFQWWSLGLVGARPVEQKKGADKGIDGRLFFHDDQEGGKTKQVVISVKAGKLHATYVRDLRGVIEREKAEIGVLLSLEAPTQKMRSEAASAGFYESPWTGQHHPRLQIITVGELLEGKGIDMPPIRQTGVTHKKAPKAKRKPSHRQKTFDE